MALVPGNPVVGGTVLRRAAIESPNFSEAAQTGWAIMQDGSAFFYNITTRGSLIIEGTGQGWFIYNGTAALGNPPIAFSVAPGTTHDPFGNTLPTTGGGVVSQVPGISFAELINGGLSMALLGALPSLQPAVLRIAQFGSGEVLLASSGNTASIPGIGTSFLILGEAASSQPGLTVTDGADGNHYDTQMLHLITPGQLVNSTSPAVITNLTAPVAARTYRIHAVLNCTQGATAAAQEFNLTGPAVAAGTTVTVYDWEESGTGEFIFGAAYNGALGNVGVPAYPVGSNFDIVFDGYIEFTAAGTFSMKANELTAGDSFTIDGGFCDLMPVAGTAGSGGAGAAAFPAPQWVNILSYGADPSGTTDSTVAIQAAWDSGFPVYMPKGLYRVSQLTWQPGLIVFGDLAGTYPGDDTIASATVLARLAATNLDLITVPDGTNYGRLQDVAIDGNRNNNTAGRGFAVLDGAAGQETQIIIERCFIHDNPGSNVYLGNNRRACKVLNSVLYRSANGDGVTVAGSDDTITGNVCGSNGRGGIVLGTTQTQRWAAAASPFSCDVAHVINNDVFANLVGIAVAHSSTNCLILGNGIDRQLNEGITVYDGDSNTIENNALHSNGTATNNTYGHIDLAVGVAQCGINNNNFGPLDAGIANVASFAVVTEPGITIGAILGNIGVIDPTSTVGGLISTAGANVSPSVRLSSGGAIIQGTQPSQHTFQVRRHDGAILFDVDDAGSFTVNLGAGKFLSTLFIGEVAAPATPSGGGVLYVDNTGHLHYLGPGGTDTTLAPP